MSLTTSNTFEGGLMMDLHPLSTPNTVLTNCLNGTYLTFNGNEYILQNDLGNGRVETAVLPSGYIPMGTTSFGGIIYIASYNPITNKCLLGCFPSPERNFTLEDLKESDLQTGNISSSDFLKNNLIKNKYVKIKLSNLKLNPGDKYLISSPNLASNANRITDYGSSTFNIGDDPKYLRFRIATTDSSGRLLYIDSNIKWYELNNITGKYYIAKETKENLTDTVLANYRSNISSEYTIFNSKLSGEIYIVAQLEMIDTFSYSYSATKLTPSTDKAAFKLSFYPEWTSNNWNSEHKGIDPKSVFVKETNSETETEYNIYSDDYDTVGGTVNDRYSDIIEKNKVNILTEANTGIIEVGTFPKNYIYNFEMTPSMEYAKIPDLTIKDSIDFSLVGTGAVSVDRWQYYVSDYTTIRYGISAYPEAGYKFSGIVMEFYDPTNKNEECIYKYVNTGRASYSGIFNLELSSDQLPLNKFYYCKITLKYQKINDTETIEKDPIYKTIYTTDIYNNEFISDTEDFSTLSLNLDATTYNVNLNSNIPSLDPTITYNDYTLNTENTENTKGYTIYTVDKDITVDPVVEFTSDIFTTSAIPEVSYDNSKSISSSITYGDIEEGLNPKDYINNDIPITLDWDNKHIKFADSIMIKSGGLTQLEVYYRGKFVPLLYNTSDMYKYGLNFDDDTGHFYYDSYFAFSHEGKICTVKYAKKGGSEKEIIDEKNIGEYSECYYEGSNDPHPYSQLNSSSYYEVNLGDFLNRYYPDLNIIPFTFVTNVDATYWLDAVRWYKDNNFAFLLDNANHTYTRSNNSTGIWSRTEFNDRSDCETDSAINSDDVEMKAFDLTKAKKYSHGCCLGSTVCGLMIKSNLNCWLMSNNFAIQNHSDSFLQRIGLNDFSLADLVAYILILTYRYDDTDTSELEYRPTSVKYLDNYIKTYSINFKSNVTFTEDNIQINGINLSDIELPSGCPRNNITLKESKTIEKSEVINYTLNVNNLLYDKYMSNTSDDILVYNIANSEGTARIEPFTKSISLSTIKLYGYDLTDEIGNRIFDLSNVNGTELHNVTVPDYSFNYNSYMNSFFVLDEVTVNKKSGAISAKISNYNNLYPNRLETLQYKDDNVLINLAKYKGHTHKTIEAELDDSSHGGDNDRLQLSGVSVDFSLSKYLTCFFA